MRRIPRTATAQNDRFLCSQARCHKSMTTCFQPFSIKRKIYISTNCLHMVKCKSAVRKDICLPWTLSNRSRLTCAEDHLNWTQQPWGTVLFVYESGLAYKYISDSWWSGNHPWIARILTRCLDGLGRDFFSRPHWSPYFLCVLCSFVL